mmetsp:Transcript_19490/g.61265  ORF Transcript_19490/g.61265 Transcript_19490/m.61265 type:complete len:782 (-) Transcript_19490:19-2364(-)
MLKTLFKKKNTPSTPGSTRAGAAIPPAMKAASPGLSVKAVESHSGQASRPTIRPLQLSGDVTTLSRSQTMSARLNPDMFTHCGPDGRATGLENVEAGLELLRLGLTAEQERALSLEARQALVDARVARARRGTLQHRFEIRASVDLGALNSADDGRQRTLHSLDLSLRGNQPERLYALNELQLQGEGVPLRFKLDLGRELLQLHLSDGQANQLTPRGRDVLVAARLARARGQISQAQPQSTSVGVTSQPQPRPQQSTIKPLGLSGVAPSMDRTDTMSARLNPDVTPHCGQSLRTPAVAASPALSLDAPANQLATVDAGLELLRLGLTEEQQRELSLEAREALIAARTVSTRQDAPEKRIGIERQWESIPQQCTLNSLDLSFRGDQLARVHALSGLQSRSVVEPFKLDLGRELLHIRLSDGQANQLTPRGRDALVAARVARARGRVDKARPQSPTPTVRPERQQPTVKLLRLSHVAPCLEHSETMSARLNPDLSCRSSRVSRVEQSERMSARYNPDIRPRSSCHLSQEEYSETMSERLNPDLSRRSSRASRQSRLTTEGTEAVMWRELGVALAAAQLTFFEEVKLSARGRDALNEARASAACRESLDASAIAAGCRWLEFAEELDSVGMTEGAEKELSVFARDALAAARGARARAGLGLLEPQESSLSKPKRHWIDLGLDLDAVGLSEREQESLSIQGRDALIAARAMRIRQKDPLVLACESSAETHHDPWMNIGLNLNAANLSEHNEQSLSKCAKDSLTVERALCARGRSALREGGEAQLS